MDENVDFDRVTNQSPNQGSSSILPNNRTDIRIDQDHCNKNQTGTRVVYGADVAKIGNEFAFNCTNELAACCDKYGPIMALNDIEFYNFYSILKSNSVKIKLVTKVTPDDLNL